ncbi:LamG-like jellyroll fold domain-containing protein [Aquirufa antheringensis]
MRHYIHYIIVSTLLLLASCEKRVWDNPFDPATNKELFTPSNLTLVQVGKQINLSWIQNNSLISGFIIQRKIDDGEYVQIANLPKGIYSFVDNFPIFGKLNQYRVTAYAGSYYSNTLSMNITPASAPIITQSLVYNLTYSSATVSYNVTDGGSPISSKGVCWNTSTQPTILNNKTVDGSGNGSFSTVIKSLKPNVKYYIRTYATNSVGTTYGTESTFTLVFKISGLQAFYPFNGNAEDESSNSYNGTITGVTSTIDRFGDSNSAMYFSGVNGTKILTTYKGITGTASRTISLWAKTSTKFVNHTSLLSYGGDPNNGQKDYGILMSNLGSTKPYIGLATNNPGGYIGNTFSNIFDGAWHHYVFVYDSSLGSSFNIIKIYIDGALVSNNVIYGSPSVNTTSNLPLVFGQFTSYNGAGAGDYRSYQGHLDDIGIYNRALTVSEIQLLFTNNL